MTKNYLILLTTFVALKGFAGVSTSGGGYAVVCRNSAQEIQSAELLDIVEGRQRYNLKIMAPTGAVLLDYTRAIENSYTLQTGSPKPVNGVDPVEHYNGFMKMVDWVESNEHLAETKDLGDTSELLKNIPAECAVEQVAVFQDQVKRVSIAKDIWNKFDSISQAALVTHEIYYEYARRMMYLPERTSERTRLATAISYSLGLTGVLDGIPEKKISRTIQHDMNPDFTNQYDKTIWSTFPVKGALRSQFSMIGGRGVLTKTYVDIPGAVSYGERYPLQGLQFKGWYALIMPAQSYHNMSGVTIRIFNSENLGIVDIQ